jgi:hypothetical protein
MSAFFFDSFASAAGTAGAPCRYIPIEQLLTSAGDGVRIQTEEFSQNAIAAVSQLHGLQTGKQATLPLVEQFVEKPDSGLEFIGKRGQAFLVSAPAGIRAEAGYRGDELQDDDADTVCNHAPSNRNASPLSAPWMPCASMASPSARSTSPASSACRAA